MTDKEIINILFAWHFVCWINTNRDHREFRSTNVRAEVEARFFFPRNVIKNFEFFFCWYFSKEKSCNKLDSIRNVVGKYLCNYGECDELTVQLTFKRRSFPLFSIDFYKLPFPTNRCVFQFTILMWWFCCLIRTTVTVLWKWINLCRRWETHPQHTNLREMITNNQTPTDHRLKPDFSFSLKRDLITEISMEIYLFSFNYSNSNLRFSVLLSYHWRSFIRLCNQSIGN